MACYGMPNFAHFIHMIKSKEYRETRDSSSKVSSTDFYIIAIALIHVTGEEDVCTKKVRFSSSCAIKDW